MPWGLTKTYNCRKKKKKNYYCLEEKKYIYNIGTIIKYLLIHNYNVKKYIYIYIYAHYMQTSINASSTANQMTPPKAQTRPIRSHTRP